MLKPDSFKRKLSPTIAKEFQDAGFKLGRAKTGRLKVMQIRQLYHLHDGKEYFPRIVDAMTSGPCTFFVVYGDPVKFRDMALKIREKYADPLEKNAALNVIHSSEPGYAEREIAICFGM